MTSLSKYWIHFLVLSLSLGLAPFFPEPHLFGKVRWVLGGAIGMGARDWFDLFLHGSPWILLLLALIGRLRQSLEQQAQSKER